MYYGPASLASAKTCGKMGEIFVLPELDLVQLWQHNLLGELLGI